MTAKKRNPNFEILRVVAMFLIVVWHYMIHGIGQRPLGVADDATTIVNLFGFELIGCLAKISTNCYILITGYFMITSKAKWRKIPKTWMPIFFYSTTIALLFWAFGWKKTGWEDLGMAALPVYFDRYWFATRYLALVALAPFFAMLAGRMTQRQYLTLLAVMFALNFNLLFGQHLSGNNSLLWFIFLFFAGGYIRLHVKTDGRNSYGKLYFLTAAGFAVFYQIKTYVRALRVRPCAVHARLSRQQRHGVFHGTGAVPVDRQTPDWRRHAVVDDDPHRPADIRRLSDTRQYAAAKRAVA